MMAFMELEIHYGNAQFMDSIFSSLSMYTVRAPAGILFPTQRLPSADSIVSYLTYVVRLSPQAQSLRR